MHAKGLCRRCYSAAYYRANQSRLLQAARDRMPPAVVRPFTMVIGCVRCGHRFTVPAVGVVACPQCSRQLRPVLEISDARCPHCRGPVPAGADWRSRYCSAACRVAAKEARRLSRTKIR